MPKGGDIHTHAAGAVYAESYIAWAAEQDMCVVRTTGAITNKPCNASDGKVPICQASLDNVLYNAMVNALSTRNLALSGRSDHDQFFAAFAKFGGGSQGDQVAEIVTRAAMQSVVYVEVMLTLRGSAVRALGSQVDFHGDFAAMRNALLAAGLRQEVTKGRAEFDMLEARVHEVLQCQSTQPQPGCAVTRRYLQQTTRASLPAQVYAQLVYAFELAQTDPRVVGLNLVAPEDHPTALHD